MAVDGTTGVLVTTQCYDQNGHPIGHGLLARLDAQTGWVVATQPILFGPHQLSVADGTVVV